MISGNASSRTAESVSGRRCGERGGGRTLPVRLHLGGHPALVVHEMDKLHARRLLALPYIPHLAHQHVNLSPTSPPRQPLRVWRRAARTTHLVRLDEHAHGVRAQAAHGAGHARAPAARRAQARERAVLVVRPQRGVQRAHARRRAVERSCDRDEVRRGVPAHAVSAAAHTREGEKGRQGERRTRRWTGRSRRSRRR